jgi:hypothetical protein
MAARYSIHPAITFGVDPFQEQLLAFQLLRATFYTGTIVEGRLKQTRDEEVRAPDPPEKGNTIRQVPVWTYQQAIGQAEPPAGVNDESSEAAIIERAMQQRHEVPTEVANRLRNLGGSDGNYDR